MHIGKTYEFFYPIKYHCEDDFGTFFVQFMVGKDKFMHTKLKYDKKEDKAECLHVIEGVSIMDPFKRHAITKLNRSDEEQTGLDSIYKSYFSMYRNDIEKKLEKYDGDKDVASFFNYFLSTLTIDEASSSDDSLWIFELRDNPNFH